MGRDGAEEGVKVEEDRRKGIENAKLGLAKVVVVVLPTSGREGTDV